MFSASYVLCPVVCVGGGMAALANIMDANENNAIEMLSLSLSLSLSLARSLVHLAL